MERPEDVFAADLLRESEPLELGGDGLTRGGDREHNVPLLQLVCELDQGLAAREVDIVRRHDTSGFSKALWIIFVIVFPYLGVLVYLIANHDGMADRSQKDVQAVQAQQDAYIKSVAGSASPADQIAQAKSLLDSGAISQAEFDALKAKALG